LGSGSCRRRSSFPCRNRARRRQKRNDGVRRGRLARPPIPRNSALSLAIKSFAASRGFPVSIALHDFVVRRGRATRCGRERIPTTTESAIRARFVRDSFYSLSTGAPTAFPVAWRARLICPLRSGRTGRTRCRMGRCYGVYFRGSRVAWWDRPCGRRRLAYLRGQRCHSFTADALAWNLETDGFEALPIYREPS